MYTLTVPDVRIRFHSKGIEKSDRSIERYCSEGRLDCVKDSRDHNRYFINQKSADSLIEKSVKNTGAENAGLPAKIVQPVFQTRTANSPPPSVAPHDTGAPSQESVGDTGAPSSKKESLTGNTIVDRYIKTLETDNEHLREANKKLLDQNGELTKIPYLLATGRRPKDKPTPPEEKAEQPAPTIIPIQPETPAPEEETPHQESSPI